jgi:hypothetical protein
MNKIKAVSYARARYLTIRRTVGMARELTIIILVAYIVACKAIALDARHPGPVNTTWLKGELPRFNIHHVSFGSFGQAFAQVLIWWFVSHKFGNVWRVRVHQHFGRLTIRSRHSLRRGCSENPRSAAAWTVRVSLLQKARDCRQTRNARIPKPKINRSRRNHRGAK